MYVCLLYMCECTRFSRTFELVCPGLSKSYNLISSCSSSREGAQLNPENSRSDVRLLDRFPIEELDLQVVAARDQYASQRFTQLLRVNLRKYRTNANTRRNRADPTNTYPVSFL